MKKTLCIIITFIMLITSLSASAAFDVSEENIMETEIGIAIKESPQNIQALFTVEKGESERRILPSETPFDIRMEKSDGTGTLEIFAAPVSYTDENGELQFIDTSMKKTGLFSGYDYENAANIFSVKYSKDATKGIKMDDAFAFSIPGAPTGLFSKKTAVGLDENKDGILTYPKAFGENTYVEYINTSTGFKENIVLEKNIGTNRFEFNWQSDTHTPILSEDGKFIQIVSNNGPDQVDYKILPLFAYDSSKSEAADGSVTSPNVQGFSEDVLSPSECNDIRENNKLSTNEKSAESLETASEEAIEEETVSDADALNESDDAPQINEYRHLTFDCYYELEKQADGSYDIIAVVSEEYLNHPETVYPVTIDPSVSTTQSSSNIADTYVSAQVPNSNYGSNTLLLFGRDQKEYKNFVYLKFNQIPSLAVPGIITKASVRVNFPTSSAYSQKTGMMLRANGSWTESGLTWNNQPYGVTPTYTSQYYSGNYYDFVITPLVQGWYNGSFANNGVDMTFYPETELGYCYMYSSEYGTASLAPKLTIEYTVSTSYSVTVSVMAGSNNANRAEFYTTGAATVESTSLTSGSDPALYNSSGSRIADDEAGNSHWRYTSVSGTHYFAGTYSNGAATYTITSTAPITLVRNGSATAYTITVSISAGTSNTNRAEFYTTGAATVESTSLTSGSDPALYNSSGTRIADDEAGNTHWRYTTVSGTHYFAGTYSNGAATYTITSTAPITLVRNASYSVTVSVMAGTNNTNRAEFYTTGAATVESTSLISGSDPALYNSSGSRIADDEAGNSHWRYTTVSGTHYYAGTYANGAATYTITSTAPITLVEHYFKIKHVQSGKYLTTVSSGSNQYGLTLSASSTSAYQKWTFQTVDAANGGYNIINGGYTTRNLARDTSAPIYCLNYIDGYNSKTLTTSFTCYIVKKDSSSTSPVYIRTSSGSSAGYYLNINYFGDTSPHFYNSTISSDWNLDEWVIEQI